MIGEASLKGIFVSADFGRMCWMCISREGVNCRDCGGDSGALCLGGVVLCLQQRNVEHNFIST